MIKFLHILEIYLSGAAITAYGSYIWELVKRKKLRTTSPTEDYPKDMIAMSLLWPALACVGAIIGMYEVFDKSIGRIVSKISHFIADRIYNFVNRKKLTPGVVNDFVPRSRRS